MAFSFVFFAGLALLFSSQRATQVGGVFLCIAGFFGTGTQGDGLGVGLGLIVVSLLVCIPVGYFVYRKRRMVQPHEDTRTCPSCGRRSASGTPVCPRCNHRFVSA